MKNGFIHEVNVQELSKTFEVDDGCIMKLNVKPLSL